MIQVREQEIFIPPSDPNEISNIGFFHDLTLVKNTWEPWEWKDIEVLRYFTRGNMLVTGETGDGKSQFMAVAAWKIRKYWGQQIVTDTPQLFTEEIGKLEVFSWEKVLRALASTAKDKKLSPTQVLADYFDLVFERAEVDLYHKTVVLDEISGRLNRRRPGDTMIQIASKFEDQFRHLFALFMMAAPHAEKKLDRNQILGGCTHVVNCHYEIADRCSYYTLKSRFCPTRYITIEDGHYWKIFNSFCRPSAK